MTKRFKVKAGRHADGDHVYEAGDIIVTDSDLDVMFANKFERLLDEAPSVSTQTQGDDETLPKKKRKARQETLV